MSMQSKLVMIALKEMKANTLVILVLLGMIFLVPKLAAIQYNGMGSPIAFLAGKALK